ncbi:MAG TPA: hypothetical protein VF522_19085 [Ramlibacter sp.]|uniref:hypothetical protein n=1 Tax=Ramlibacter sp. TaxID=1917967 RepID=UPI002ED3C1AF
MGVAGQEDALDTELEQGNNEAEDEPQDGADEGEEGADGSDGADDAEEGSEGEDETVVQFGEEEPPASEDTSVTAPPWVKELRVEQKRLRKENAELRAKLGTGQPGAQQKPTLPPKPKMSDSDIDYDEEKFEQARDAWDVKKRELDSWEANQQAAANAQEERARKANEAYSASKSSLKVKDFGEAEDAVAAAIPEDWRQAILKTGPRNPGALVYALGKNPKRLQELASIKDPVKFAVAIGKLETEVKVTKRTSTKPAPETTVRSQGGASGNSKATLERLEAEAERTGDRSKVAAFKRQLQAAGKK